MATKKEIFEQLKIKGLTIRADAMKTLVAQLSQSEDPHSDLETFISFIQCDGKGTPMIDLTRAKSQLIKVQKTEKVAVEESKIAFLSAFDAPKFVFTNQSFSSVKSGPLHGSASSRSDIFAQRLAIVRQRLLRHPQFSPPASRADEGTTEYHKLTSIDSLVGALSGRKYVLGKISEITEGCYYLEDARAKVPLNLSGAVVAAGCFNTGCIVLAEGEMAAGLFRVDHLGHPIPEAQSVTRSIFPRTDFFGTQVDERVRSSLEQIETEDEDATILVLSEVCLDVPKVWLKLQQLLDGYSDLPPTALLLIGNFLSRNFGDEKDHYQTLCSGMERLARLISRFPQIVKHTKIVIIPGPGDPASGILPSPPLSSVFFSSLSSILPSAVGMSNPCRMRYCTQNIVVFRDNLVNSMRRHCLIPPNRDLLPSLNQHVVKTVLDQGYLCPLPLNVRPVFWNYAHSLSLYPLPDVVILADKYPQYSTTYEGVVCFNPGSFSQDYTFVAYYPSSRETEFCKVSEETNQDPISITDIFSTPFSSSLLSQQQEERGEKASSKNPSTKENVQISSIFQKVSKEDWEREREEEEEEEEEEEDDEEMVAEEVEEEEEEDEEKEEEERGEDSEAEEEEEEGQTWADDIKGDGEGEEEIEEGKGEKEREKEEMSSDEDDELGDDVAEEDLSDHEREERKKRRKIDF